MSLVSTNSAKFPFKAQFLASFQRVYECWDGWRLSNNMDPEAKDFLPPTLPHFIPITLVQRLKEKRPPVWPRYWRKTKSGTLFQGTSKHLQPTGWGSLQDSTHWKLHSFVWKNSVFYQMSKKECWLYLVIEKLLKGCILFSRSHLLEAITGATAAFWTWHQPSSASHLTSSQARGGKCWFLT